MSKIKGDMTITEMVATLAEDNIDSARVLFEVFKIDPEDPAEGFNLVLNFDTLGIYGSRIYTLWNDVCNRDTVKMAILLRAVQWGQLGGSTPDAIHHALENSGRGLNIEAVINAFKELYGGRDDLPAVYSKYLA